MIRVADVMARIEERVPDLAGKLGTATDFAALIERNQVPQRPGASGFVLPGRLSGGPVGAMSGLFTQSVGQGVIVVLSVRVASDPTGAAALDQLSPVVDRVIRAVCGWSPDDAPGVWALVSAELVGSTAGVLIYQIDFTLQDQLRITP